MSCAIWDLAPCPWIEPTSPALQDRFLTTGPPEKPLKHKILMLSMLAYVRVSLLDLLSTEVGSIHTHGLYVFISSVQSLSRVRFLVTSWTIARQASLSITNSWSLLKLMSIQLMMPSNHLILCHPLLLLPSIFPSIRVFSNESVLRIRWPKYWSFSFSIRPSNEYSGLISFRMD